MKRLIKRIIVTLVICMLVVVVIVGGLLLAMPYFFSPAKVKYMLQHAVEENSDYELLIPGELRYTGFPQFVVRLDEAQLRKGAQAWNLQDLTLKTNLIALLKKDVTLDIDGQVNAQPVDLKIDIPDALQYGRGADGASAFIAVSDQPFSLKMQMQKPVLLALEATTQRQGSRYHLRDMRAKFSSFKAQGNVQFASGKMPYIEGKLTTNMVDIDALKTALERLKKPFVPQRAAAVLRHTTVPSEHMMPAALKPWSRAPYDLSVLNTFEANVEVEAAGIKTSALSLGHTRLHIQNQNGVAVFTLREAQLYGGTASGKATVDARRSTPKITKDMALTQISIGDFLRDMAGITRLDAKGDVHLTFTTRGNNQKTLIQNLNGQGVISTQEGVLRDLDLSVLSAFKTGDLKQLARLPQAINSKGKHTPLLSSRASFTIKNGVMNNQDLQVQLPQVAVTGKGKIDLPNQSIDYVATPTLSESSKQWSVPLAIKGPLDDPNITLSQEFLGGDLMQNGLQRLLESGEADNLREKLLGDEGAGDAADALKNKLLDKLF